MLQEARSTLSGRAVRRQSRLPDGRADRRSDCAEAALGYGHKDRKPVELVVMTSHGRHGLARWTLGSVADRMLHGPAPVLVLHPGQGAEASSLMRGLSCMLQDENQ